MQRLFITQILIIAFWGIFALELFLSQSTSPHINVLVNMGGLAKTISHESYRHLTHLFLHGSFLHVIMNSIALYFSGRFLEALLGRGWFLTVFTLSGYSAALIAMNFSDPHVVLIGASGSVMGVLGCLLYCAFLMPKSPIRKELIRNSYQIIIPSLIPLFSGVSYSAHLGGVITGLMLGFFITLLFKISQRGAWLLGILGSIFSGMLLAWAFLAASQQIIIQIS